MLASMGQLFTNLWILPARVDHNMQEIYCVDRSMHFVQCIDKCE